MPTREKFGKSGDLEYDGKRKGKVGGDKQNSRLQEIFYYLSEDTKGSGGKKGFSVRDHRNNYKGKLDDMMDNITNSRMNHTGHISRNTKTRSFLPARGGSDYVSRRIAENFAAHQPTELLFEEASKSVLEDKTPKSATVSKGTGGQIGKRITFKNRDPPNDFSQFQAESARNKKDSWVNDKDTSDPANPFLANLPKAQKFSIKFQALDPLTPGAPEPGPKPSPPEQTYQTGLTLKVPLDTETGPTPGVSLSQIPTHPSTSISLLNFDRFQNPIDTYQYTILDTSPYFPYPVLTNEITVQENTTLPPNPQHHPHHPRPPQIQLSLQNLDLPTKPPSPPPIPPNQPSTVDLSDPQTPKKNMVRGMSIDMGSIPEEDVGDEPNWSRDTEGEGEGEGSVEGTEDKRMFTSGGDGKELDGQTSVLSGSKVSGDGSVGEDEVRDSKDVLGDDGYEKVDPHPNPRSEN